MQIWSAPGHWFRDVVFGLHLARRRSAFSAMVVITLALGTATATIIYSLVDAILIRPLPYPASEQLVVLNEQRLQERGSLAKVAPARLEDWEDLNAVFDGVAGSYIDSFAETTSPVPQRIVGALVSQRFFRVIGVQPVSGRVFNESEEVFGGPNAVIISDRLWGRMFNREPAAIGRSLVLEGQTYSIVGVMPATFQYPSDTVDVWVARRPSPALMQVRRARNYDVVARLQNGVTVERAHADMNAVQQRLGELYPDSDAGWGVVVYPLKERVVGATRQGLWALFGSVGLLLLIACGNVACLMLVRFQERSTEFAMRRALGAMPGAIARQLVSEGFAYALLASVVGGLIAFGGITAVKYFMSDLPRVAELAMNSRVLVFATLVGIVTAVLCSLAPVARITFFGGGGAVSLGGWGTAKINYQAPNALVCVQFMFATVLLIVATLLVRSLINLEGTPLGLEPDNVLTFRVSASFGESQDAVVQRHQATLAELVRAPGVETLAMADGLPATGATRQVEFRILGADADVDAAVPLLASTRAVTADYFKVLEIPLLQGRTCNMTDNQSQPFEALVNRTLADRFPGQSLIGKTVVVGPAESADSLQIVGMVGDVREEAHARQPAPTIYSCGVLRYWPDSPFLARIRGDFNGTTTLILDRLRSLEPSRAVYAVRSLDDVLSSTLSEQRFRSVISSLFSVMALIVTATGLYGTLAYAVTLRTGEIAVRMALGARSERVARDVLSTAAVLAAVGIGIGLVLAAVASQMARGLLFGISPVDVPTYVGVIGVILLVAFFASLAPAARAASIAPSVTLKAQ